MEYFLQSVNEDLKEPTPKLGRKLASDGIRTAKCVNKKVENHLDNEDNSYITAEVHC